MPLALSEREMASIFTTVAKASADGSGEAKVGTLERDAGQWMYYRWPEYHLNGNPVEKPGRIIKMQHNAVAYQDNTLRKGLIPLAAYGRFAEYPNMHLDPFRHLFMAGGAKEFPVWQIREYMWHRNPPEYTLNGQRLKVKFPQIEINPETGNVIQDGVELVDVQCPDCKKWFISDGGMRAHAAVDHKAVAAQRATAHEMGEATRAIAAAVQSSSASQNNALTQAFESLTTALSTMNARQSKLEDALAVLIQQQGRPARPA